MNGDSDRLISEIHATVHQTAATVAELPRKHEVTESIHDAIREHTEDCRSRPSRGPGSRVDPLAVLKWVAVAAGAFAALATGYGLG